MYRAISDVRRFLDGGKFVRNERYVPILRELYQNARNNSLQNHGSAPEVLRIACFHELNEYECR